MQHRRQIPNTSSQASQQQTQKQPSIEDSMVVDSVGGVDIVPPVFQIASDLHVEFVQDISHIKINPSAPYLVLAGDIGILIYQRNHEFYNGEYTAVKSSITAICKKLPNVVFLDRTAQLLGGGGESQIRVLGTTLWSHIPSQNASDVQNGLNDYRLIKFSSRSLTVQDTVQFFNEEVAWLKREIQTAKQKNERVLIITHHAPLKKGTSDPQYETSSIECAFTSDLSSLMGDPVKAWIYGHTHYSSYQVFKGTKVVSNQHGYIGHNEKTNYKDDFIIRLDD